MKIKPTSLMFNAISVDKISQGFYRPKGSEKKQKTSNNIIFQKINFLKQELLYIQTNISKKQALYEGLKAIRVELYKLKNSFNKKGLERFYENANKISKRFSYNKENLILKELGDNLYKDNLELEKLSSLKKKITDTIKVTVIDIAKEKLNLKKLEVSSENIISLSTVNGEIFNYLKDTLDRDNLELVSKLHNVERSEHLRELYKTLIN